MTSSNFVKALNLKDSCAMVIGSMIGSGIFLVSAQTARLVQSPCLFLLIWVLASLMTILAATCTGELASLFPKAGGQYVYLKNAYNNLVAFLYGWTLFSVIQTGTIAAVAVAFAKFLSVFIPCLSTSNIIFSIFNFPISSLQLVAVGLICLLTLNNCLGINAAKFIQNFFTLLKLISLVGIILLGVSIFNRASGLTYNLSHFFDMPTICHSNTGFFILTALAGIIGPLFSMDAWNNVTFTSEEVINPEITLPKSLFIGTCVVCTLYILINVIYLVVLPLHGSPHGTDIISCGIQYATEDRVATAVLEVILGKIGVYIMAAAIMISTFGGLNSLILAAPRVYYAMAEDGLFFKFASKIHPKSKVPVMGLVLQGIWASLLTFSGSYSNLLEYVIFATLFFYILTIGSVFLFRQKFSDRPRLFKVPFYPVTPALYIVLALTIMVAEVVVSPNYCLASVLIVISGLPAY